VELVFRGKVPDMSALLDLPEARQRVKRWTVDEYERLAELNVLGKNVELIRGVIVEKMSKSPLHRFTALALYDTLSRLLPEGFFAMHEAPLRLVGSEPEPDVSVVKGRAVDFLHSHPTTATLVIEVAVSSASLDRENAGLYAEAGVEEYWIVLPQTRRVEIYRGPHDGAYADTSVCDAPALLQSTSVPAIQVDLGVLFPREG